MSQPTPTPDGAAPLTLLDAARALREGSVTSVQLTRAALARADALDERLGVYLERFDAEALASARRADAERADGVDRGPLHGIPVGVKDILAAAEGATTAQSLVHDPAWGSGKDATVVARLRAAGAVIAGKTTTMEFAIGAPDPAKPFPVPHNPWDVERWPGGSSSGTGAGVAAGLFLAGVGTDTGGSIRVPAAFCGVTGLMPTFGRVPNSGCVPLGFSLDHIGPLARTARDCGAFLEAIAGPAAEDPSSRDEPVGRFDAGAAGGSLEGVRVGVERANHFPGDGDPAVAERFEAAVEALGALGATVAEVELPHHAETLTAMMITSMCEAMAYHRDDLRARWEEFTPGTRGMIASGALFSGADYVQAQRVRRVAQRALGALMTGVDVIATPTAGKVAPTCEEVFAGGAMSVYERVHTTYWNAVGNPAMVVPMGFNADGMPLGLQLAARPFEEALLVRVGDAYQGVTDWHLRVPPIAADLATVNA
ncbi:MAG TPA: amidase [Baekduia sp.]|uniref:amidase n=1 Tax=Baekduia sp. TaxID=2600305 RepID=UPI002D776251|nr:amidase [Baekduia sp.]HET6509985.1 amidase [Baekduia sp.]